MDKKVIQEFEQIGEALGELVNGYKGDLGVVLIARNNGKSVAAIVGGPKQTSDEDAEPILREFAARLTHMADGIKAGKFKLTNHGSDEYYMSTGPEGAIEKHTVEPDQTTIPEFPDSFAN